MARKKPDKWRNELTAALNASAQKQAELDVLLKEQKILRGKQEVMNQLSDCFSVITQVMSEYGMTHSAEWALVGQQMELGWSHSGGARNAFNLPGHVVSYLRATHDPQLAQQVLALSDKDILLRVRACLGKCAIMVLQDQANEAWLQHQQVTSTASASQSLQPHLQPQHQQDHAAQVAGGCRQPLNAADPCNPQHASCIASPCPSLLSLSSTQTAVNDAAALTCLDQMAPGMQASAIWSVLFNWAEARFMKMAGLDLETFQELRVQPAPDFGKWLGTKLQLRSDQISVLRGLRDLVKQPHEGLPAEIHAVSVQQQQLTEHQQEQPWADSFGSAGQVLEAHERALQQQAAALVRFRIMAKFMGLVTLSTLSPSQLSALHVYSFPSIPRIEPVLDALDELQPCSP